MQRGWAPFLHCVGRSQFFFATTHILFLVSDAKAKYLANGARM